MKNNNNLKTTIDSYLRDKSPEDGKLRTFIDFSNWKRHKLPNIITGKSNAGNRSELSDVIKKHLSI